MRKLFAFCATLIGVIGLIGCTEDANDLQTPTGDDNGNNGGNTEVVEPEITIREVEVTPNTITFEVTTNVAGTLGYKVSPAGYKAPTPEEWFSANTAEVSGTQQITVNELNDDTEYVLYAMLRSNNGNLLSDPHKLNFTTPDDGVANPITVLNTTYNTISFVIDIPGSYVFQCIDKGYLQHENLTIEEYITTAGIGIHSSGKLELDWVDGQPYGPYTMRVREDSDYYIVAAITDGQTITSTIYYRETRTPKRPQSVAGLTTELMDITSTSVTVKTTPDANVSSYYVYVRDKAWSDSIVDGYGESMLATLVKYPNAGAWNLTAANEAVWDGLIPTTEYICHILVLDDRGGESLSLIPFTTLGATGEAPKVEGSITFDSEAGYSTLNINIYSENAHSVRIAFNTLGDVDDLRSQGNTDTKIVSMYGMDLSAEQVNAVKSTGLSLKQEDLFPGVEYVAIVSVKNAEQTETIKVMAKTTSQKPIPARVDSELFTSLLGEWEVSYPLVQFNNQDVNITNAKVTIAAGADDETAEYYRSHNRLVIQGWPFNVEADGTHAPMPYYSPADLKEMSSYWRDFAGLALRDFGPKIFLEIAEGNVITVPSSRSEYLYNWAADGTFYFYGADIQNEFTAPASFPVTLSDDGNTLTIGVCNSGAEFGYGNYRPSVFRYGTEAWALATGDIVLKRVK